MTVAHEVASFRGWIAIARSQHFPRTALHPRAQRAIEAGEAAAAQANLS